ncbi:LSM_domain protein [Hexamita inflata]|uniref:LSM domain protein n=1 Tax=Hexamita inflata TaxID=28002 RepID=A0AA86TQI6_9EUKA|nr:LSM domain protein [Hexamita inflata]CAI9936244.1 LSM domain protein [Hexamita inflata]CAI9966698.1 LSM domain protein [Hexamita inflata]CAI9970044.1 LSM domain protein [Hexamita inflata]
MTIVTPKLLLQTQIGKQITVELKWNSQITGILQSFDEYMNLRLKDATFGDQTISDMLLRCNNVLYIITE